MAIKSTVVARLHNGVHQIQNTSSGRVENTNLAQNASCKRVVVEISEIARGQFRYGLGSECIGATWTLRAVVAV